MKKQWIISAGIFLFSMVLLTGINAQPHQRSGQGHGPQMSQQRNKSHQHALNLSDEQKEEIKAIRLDHYKAMKPLKNAMIELKASERTLMSEESVNLNKVNSVIDEQTELMNKMRKLQAKQKVNIKNVFSDEQLMKLDQQRKIRKHRKASNDRFDRNRGFNRNRGFDRNRGFNRVSTTGLLV